MRRGNQGRRKSALKKRRLHRKPKIGSDDRDIIISTTFFRYTVMLPLALSMYTVGVSAVRQYQTPSYVRSNFVTLFFVCVDFSVFSWHDPTWNRTSNLLITGATLYPLSYCCSTSLMYNYSLQELRRIFCRNISWVFMILSEIITVIKPFVSGTMPTLADDRHYSAWQRRSSPGILSPSARVAAGIQEPSFRRELRRVSTMRSGSSPSWQGHDTSEWRTLVHNTGFQSRESLF